MDSGILRPYFEVILLNRQWQEIGSLNSFVSLIWRPAYQGLGDGEIHAEKSYFELFQKAAYAIVKDNRTKEIWPQTLVIERLQLQQDKGTTMIKGVFLEKLFHDYIVTQDRVYRGRTGAMMHALVRDFVLNSDEPLEKLVLKGVGEELGESAIADQLAGKSVLTRLQEMADSQDLSFRLFYHYLQNQIHFEVWQGKNRSSLQQENTYAIFNEGDGQVLSSSYSYSEADYKNFAYISAEMEGNRQTIVTVDLRNNRQEMRRAIWIEAKEKPEDGMSEQEYLEMLRQSGREHLAKYGKVEAVEATINPDAGLVYGQDYDLGDLCEYIDDQTGLVVQQRITSLVKTIENGLFTIEPVFGNEQKSIIERIEREVR